MSDGKLADETEPNTSKVENQNNANGGPSIKNIDEAGAVLPLIENVTSTQEVVINLSGPADEKPSKNYDSKNVSVFGYGQIQQPTWVLYEGGYPSAPLSYDNSRNGFIRLTMGIVLVMILITAAFVALVLFHSGLNDIFRAYGFIIAIPAMIVMVGLGYVIACSPCSRVFPSNIVTLVIAVICMSLICSYITCRYRTEIVFYAVLATSIVVFICILLAFTSFDFTKYMLYIVVISAAFSAIALITLLAMLLTGTYMKIVHLIILIIATVINCVVLTMELQMILGGKTVEIGEDDYALAAYLIYTSIVDIFIKLVQILGIIDQF